MIHLRSGEAPPMPAAACGALRGLGDLGNIVDEIHLVTCDLCKRLFREATLTGKAAFAKAVALAVARTQLEQIEDLQEQAREKLEAVAKLPPELAKLFDDLEKSAYALLRYLQEFQP